MSEDGVTFNSDKQQDDELGGVASQLQVNEMRDRSAVSSASGPADVTVWAINSVGLFISDRSSGSSGLPGSSTPRGVAAVALRPVYIMYHLSLHICLPCTSARVHIPTHHMLSSPLFADLPLPSCLFRHYLHLDP